MRLNFYLQIYILFLKCFILRFKNLVLRFQFRLLRREFLILSLKNSKLLLEQRDMLRLHLRRKMLTPGLSKEIR